MTCGIYAVTHKETRRVYVGQSCDVKQRWAEHRYRAKVGMYRGNPFYDDLRAAGPGGFLWETVEECAKRFLNRRESYWMRELNARGENGYNRKALTAPRRKA